MEWVWPVWLVKLSNISVAQHHVGQPMEFRVRSVSGNLSNPYNPALPHTLSQTPPNTRNKSIKPSQSSQHPKLHPVLCPSPPYTHLYAAQCTPITS